MIAVTINDIWLKCYLNICIMCKCDFTNIHIVADKMRSIKTLAIALNKLNGVSIKKINKKIHSTFSTLISVFPSLYSTIQFTLSPISAPRNFMISLGIVVLADELFGRAIEILDSYSNTFISPIFVNHYIYIYTQVIYNGFHKIGRNIYILRVFND